MDLKNGPVLIIDDNHSIVELVDLILRKEEFSVIKSYAGVDGIGKAEKENPCLILLDIMLPDLNGIEILERMRRFTGVPIIMLTVENDLDSVQKTITLGANDYLLKPFTAKELLARMRKNLNMAQNATPVKN
jgi:DNA-binding response OmpR family regulator